MRLAPCLLLAGLVLAAHPIAARSEVVVTFTDPERFTDARLRGGYGAPALAPALDGIARHLAALGARDLPPNQTLTIEVRDIDLAGRFEPWRPLAYDVRYLREITWPRIKLRYVLQQDGNSLMSAEETIADQDYLRRPSGRFASDPLGYEKAMLDDWFRRRFVEHRPPPA
jgi:hypothetical protein